MSKKSLIDEIVNIVSQLDNKNFSIKITESGGKTRTVYLNDPRLSSNLAFKTIDNLKLILEYAKTLVGKEEKKEETSVPSQVVNEKQEVKIPTVAKQNEVKVQENKIPSQHLYKTKNQLINEIVSESKKLSDLNHSINVTEQGSKQRNIRLNQYNLERNLNFINKNNLAKILDFTNSLVKKEDKKRRAQKPSKKYSVVITFEPVKLEKYTGTSVNTLGSIINNSRSNILVYKPGTSVNWWQYVPAGTLQYHNGWIYNYGANPMTFSGSAEKKFAAILPQQSATYQIKSRNQNLTAADVSELMKNGKLIFNALQGLPYASVYIRSFTISVRQIGGRVNIMKERLYQNEIDIEGAETNASKGDCVVQVLEFILNTRSGVNPNKKSTRGRKPKIINILAELEMKERTEGVSPEKLLAFCEKHNIRLGLCDQAYKVLCQNYPEKYEARKGIFGMVSNNHLYLFDNKVVIDHIFTKKEKDTISFDKKLKTPKCKSCGKEFADSWLLSRHVDEEHSKRKIVIVEDFNKSLIKYIKDNNKIPFISNCLTRFNDNNTLYQLATIDETKEISQYPELCKSFDMPQYSSIATLSEKLFERSFKNYKSHFNDITRKIFFSNCPTPYVEQTNIYINGKEYFQHDITKFYSAILASMEAPIFSFLDLPTKYNGKIQSPGFYYTERHGWLADTLIEILQVENDILYQLLPSRTIPKKDLYDFVNMIFKVDEQLAKKIICYLTGMLRKIDSKVLGKPAVVKNHTDIHYFHYAKAKQHIIDPDGEFTLFQFQDITPKFSSAIPIYNYIIQTGRAVITKVKQYAESQNATVYQVNTDAIVTDKALTIPCQFNLNKVDEETGEIISNAIYEKKIGQFKPIDHPENITNKSGYSNRIGFSQIYCHKESSCLNYIIPEESDDPLDCIKYLFNDCHAMEILKHNDNILITGMPGCGKSYTAQKIKEDFIERNIRYYEMSFQNNVCADISDKANTFHKAFAMPLESFSQTRVNIIKKFKKYKWIFVDEFQMTPDFILPYLFIIKQECGCKFILSGDFNQWGPIECSYDIDNIAVSKLYDGNVYEIYGNQRIIDKDYVDALTYKDFREAIKQCSYKEKTKYTITYYSRPDINIGSHKQNIKAYKHFTGLKYITKKIKNDQGEVINVVPDYKIVKNMPIICKKSSSTKALIKGRHYTVFQVNTIKNGSNVIGHKIYIDIDTNFHDDTLEEYICLTREEYFEHMDLGYAFTSHKSIGLTIKAPYSIILSDIKDADTYERYLYVSLSRCKDPKNINIIGKYKEPKKYRPSDEELQRIMREGLEYMMTVDIPGLTFGF